MIDSLFEFEKTGWKPQITVPKITRAVTAKELKGLLLSSNRDKRTKNYLDKKYGSFFYIKSTWVIIRGKTVQVDGLKIGYTGTCLYNGLRKFDQVFNGNVKLEYAANFDDIACNPKKIDCVLKKELQEFSIDSEGTQTELYDISVQLATQIIEKTLKSKSIDFVSTRDPGEKLNV